MYIFKKILFFIIVFIPFIIGFVFMGIGMAFVVISEKILTQLFEWAPKKKEK